MDSTQELELLKSRNFGDQITLTFNFLRGNFKPLGRAILFIAGPAVVLASAISGYAFANVFDMFGATPSASVPMIMLAGLIWLIAFALLTTVINEYVVLYAEKGGDGFSFDEIWEETRRDVGKVVITLLVTYVAVAIGLLLFFIPGMYLLVTTSTIVTVRINERVSLGEAFSRSKELIQENWWVTLGLMALMGFIAGIIRNFFSIPLWFAMFLEGLAASTAETGGLSWVMIVCSILSFVGAFLTAALPILAMALQYFNLVEKAEGVGLLTRIEQIGSAENNGSLDAGTL